MVSLRVARIDIRLTSSGMLPRELLLDLARKARANIPDRDLQEVNIQVDVGPAQVNSGKVLKFYPEYHMADCFGIPTCYSLSISQLVLSEFHLHYA